MTGLRAAEYSLSLIKKYWHCGLAVILAVNFALIQIPCIAQKLQSYAISSTEEAFGGRLLSKDQEQKIREIAQKLGVIQTINIRKMNAQSLQQFGYHNAFAYFPHIFNIFPVGDQVFMYISEGFFEDLSPEEQDFLIGHELVHIKLGHTKYIPIIYLVLFILITLGVWQLRKRYGFLRYWMVTIGVWLALMWTINLGHLSYRRHIERMADIQSLECLGTYKGLLKIIERWMREYKMPLHNDYYGIFADHPSVWQRQAYCLELQHNHKGS